MTMRIKTAAESRTSGAWGRLGRYRFAVGVLTGAALSSMVPWSTLESIAPGIRLASLAALCAAFVTFRIVSARRKVRVGVGALAIAAGGFLLSVGPRLAQGFDIVLVEVGAISFLCGLAILLRSRGLTPEEREQALERLLQDEHLRSGPGDDPAGLKAAHDVRSDDEDDGASLGALERLLEADAAPASSSRAVH